MSTVSSPKNNGSEGIFTIGELGEVVCRRWKLISVCILVSLVCAVALYAIVPSKWKGTVTFQIGRLPQKAANESPLIESSDQLVSRVESKEFLNQVLERAGIPASELEKPAAVLLGQSLKAIAIRNADFVQVSFSAYTTDGLKTFGSAIAQEVLIAHGRVSSPIRQRLAADLKSISKDISQADQDRLRLNAELNALKAAPGDRQLVTNITLLGLLESNSTHQDRLRKVRADLDRDMAPSNLSDSTATAVQIDRFPYFPKLGVFLALGVIFGAIAGLIIALIASRRQKLPA